MYKFISPPKRPHEASARRRRRIFKATCGGDERSLTTGSPQPRPAAGTRARYGDVSRTT